MSTKDAPKAAATVSPIPDATFTAWMDRSGFPAPRFCPATAAVAPMRPTDVQVMKENSST